MATTYSAAQAAGNVPPKYLHAGAIVRSASYALTAALALNDAIQMFKLPAGAVVHEVILASDDVDTNASPTVKYDVGDGSLANRFIAATTIGQAGGVARMDQKGGVGFKCTADTMIQVTVNTAPATGTASGAITLTVSYTMDA